MNRVARVVVIVALVAALFGLGVYAEGTDDERRPYPSYEDINTNYDQYVGQDTLLFGTVEQIDGSAAVIAIEYDTGSFLMDVSSFEGTVQPGGVVQVYGTLEPDYTISAQDVVVVNPTGRSDLFKYAISAVAVVLFLVAFFRYWWPNVRELRLEAREDG